MSEHLLLAVDGGNTKTDALLVDAAGRVLGVGRSGTSDIYAPAGEAAAYEQLTLAVDEALAAAGRQADALTGAALRLAGIDWPEDVAAWRSWLRRELPTGLPVSLDNDGVALLRCVGSDGVGVALTVGTSYAVGARGPLGATWSLNNWGQHHLGATGLGLDGYRAAMLAELGLGPATAITPRLLDHVGVPDADALVHQVTRRNTTINLHSFALMAPEITACAADGDAVAGQIVERHAQALADYLRVAAGRVGLGEEFTVALDGSVVRAPGSGMRAALERRVAEDLPGVRLLAPQLPPVAGVALDALAEAGLPLESARAHLQQHFA